MKKRIFLILVAFIFCFWFVYTAKEIFVLMNKYPEAFKKNTEHSIAKFYSTYKTLSFAKFMIKRGETSSSMCYDLRFEEAEKEKYYPLVKAELDKFIPNNNYEPSYFENIGANCTHNAKMIGFKFKENYAFATFACENGDLIEEFTYSPINDGLCVRMQYKKDWGIQPLRTLDSAYYPIKFVKDMY